MMRICLCLVMLGLLPAHVVSAQDQAAYAISGIVVRQGTKEPLNHVRVMIAPNEHPAKQISVLTATDGKFTFTNIPRGKYVLVAQSQGVAQSYEQDGAFSTGIAAGPDDDSTHIVFPLQGNASLLVKISDEEHEPVTAAQVLLFRRQVQMGWPNISLDRQASTDSEGEARVANLEPGIYYVAVSGRPWYAQSAMQGPVLRGSAAKELDVAYPITYYPSTEDPAEATALQLQEGNAAEVQIGLRAIPAVSITITGMSGESDPARGGQFATSIEAVGPGGVAIPIFATEYGQDNNRRVLQGLAPGSYRLTEYKFGESGQQPLGGTRVDARGDAEMNVSDFVRTSVSGRLAIPGVKSGVVPAIWLGQPMSGQNAYCPVHPDGSFECIMGGSASGSILPGYYQVALQGTGDLYVKSLAAKGARYSGGLLRIGEGSSVDLSIVAAKGLTNVEGVALREGKPIAGAMILLLPQGPDSAWVTPRDQSDSDGTFKLRNVPPGRYLLLAIDNGKELEYHDPKIIAPYLARGRAIEIPVAASELLKAEVQARQ